ncbi:MAG: NAD(P)/FAD-dependent oxidoreductase [Candidatus Marinimicrobia bacterium]|jgi:hypothetical protein|nr:NAD(P)/FAD-dependent oxidoreductase [Candidatus Neomarinimicrobiota bacterium]MBT3936661.1 NAD(P)/FAD-dependent oxidoreductase [Candidatus Neomarinimicrobiota bacterium]MBT3961667.1 NAD(P)/FAD-dependent oxidoreductase [Candidatus Neomarinimicrobiota bacterium]MBT4382138.1 NAD(P)/FAD-dependent oxidoreductase [Candidatus Neomarinimicrobiota bacterium]MBT4636795.1 NAD(P)/FAD-dependent oxidoreductase [Candidatus Neomarinimicrobiota bacterium]
MKKYDAIIIGAGAAGLMCAIEAGKRNRSVLLIEKEDQAGKKILISGGGRCNFTNLFIESDSFISHNSHFFKSALARYSCWDFISLMEKHNLTWTEKTKGQLFCDQNSKAILSMLLDECHNVGVDFAYNSQVKSINQKLGYSVETNKISFHSSSLVIATGGPSIPKLGASDFGNKVAQQFKINTFPFTPALVPFTFSKKDIEKYFKGLSGLSFNGKVSCNKHIFRDNILITHKGLSGPAILQISSYWTKGDSIRINILPDLNAAEWLIQQKGTNGDRQLKSLLSQFLPKRLALRFSNELLPDQLANKSIGNLSIINLMKLGQTLNSWTLIPNGTLGFQSAEVSTGGIDTNELSSKTMESKNHPSLFFIGETVDVTGWLGGFNFQWAWASGWAAGQII